MKKSYQVAVLYRFHHIQLLIHGLHCLSVLQCTEQNRQPSVNEYSIYKKCLFAHLILLLEKRFLRGYCGSDDWIFSLIPLLIGCHEKGALILAEKCSFGLQQSKRTFSSKLYYYCGISEEQCHHPYSFSLQNMIL